MIICWNCKKQVEMTGEDKGGYWLCSCGATVNKKEVVLQGAGLAGTQKGADGGLTGKANPIPSRKMPKRRKVIETTTIPTPIAMAKIPAKEIQKR